MMKIEKQKIELRHITNFINSDKYRAEIHNLIPGGAHTYSKGDDQFPELSPAAIEYGQGAYIWDIDGNQYLDCSMGLSSVSLGHAYQPTLKAVIAELKKGVNFQRPSSLEKKMAEKFLSLVPNHDMVKFSKNGSTVTSAAVKLARAYTNRELVAFPMDHPFYSYDDWFIGSTQCNKGVTKESISNSLTFKSCDIESLKSLFERYPNKIACVITEPEKNTCNSCSCKTSPEVFLKQAIELCHENGALFIVDEMVTGFKTSFPGSMTKFGINPDMATWGKGIANGFSFCALTGKKEIMELGGIRDEGREKVFLISSTHGGETHAMAAAIATIDEFINKDVIKHNHLIGRKLTEICSELLRNKQLEKYINLIVSDWLPAFIFKDENLQVNQKFRTLFMQEMIKRGVLFQGFFVPCYSHTEFDLSYFITAFSESLKIYSEALQNGVDKYLVGKPAKPVFRKIL
jgi:glutamate-1-semialdehyde aminotransferase